MQPRTVSEWHEHWYTDTEYRFFHLLLVIWYEYSPVLIVYFTAVEALESPEEIPNLVSTAEAQPDSPDQTSKRSCVPEIVHPPTSILASIGSSWIFPSLQFPRTSASIFSISSSVPTKKRHFIESIRNWKVNCLFLDHRGRPLPRITVTFYRRLHSCHSQLCWCGTVIF